MATARKSAPKTRKARNTVAPTLTVSEATEFPKLERARSGRQSMHPGFVRQIVGAQGKVVEIAEPNVGRANQRRRALLDVPVTGGVLEATVRQTTVLARFVKGKGAITVAGEPLETAAS